MNIIALIGSSDSPSVSELAREVEECGYAPRLFRSVGHWLPHSAESHLVVLAEDLPDTLGACRLIGTEHGVEVVVLMTQNSAFDMLTAFENGATEVIPYPSPVRDLRARILAVAKRIKPSRRRTTPKGQLPPPFLDLTLKDAIVNGKRNHLQGIEFNILRYLVEHPDKVCSKRQLAQVGWGDEELANDHTVEATLSRVRARFEEHGGERPFQNVRGLGYRICTALKCSGQVSNV